MFFGTGTGGRSGLGSTISYINIKTIGTYLDNFTKEVKKILEKLLFKYVVLLSIYFSMK